MLGASSTSALINVGQKYIVFKTAQEGNPMHVFEYTYSAMLYLAVLYLLTMKFTTLSFFPIPKDIRRAFIIRCIAGCMCHVCLMMSLNYISLTQASVLFWTSPVFTALFANQVLKERLTVFDWAAVFVAFSGILIMQNPFSQSLDSGDGFNDIFGSALALTGAVFVGTATVAIRTMNHYSSNIGILVAPMGFVLGNVTLCPLFMTLKLIFSPVDPRSQMVTTD
jgi:drug/metabolite transporter (DMT)-like permease